MRSTCLALACALVLPAVASPQDQDRLADASTWSVVFKCDGGTLDVALDLAPPAPVTLTRLLIDGTKVADGVAVVVNGQLQAYSDLRIQGALCAGQQWTLIVEAARIDKSDPAHGSDVLSLRFSPQSFIGAKVRPPAR